MAPKKRPGFRLPEKIVTLVFEDEDGPYAGLEVDVSLTTTVGFLLKMAAYAPASEGEPPTWTLEEMYAAMREWATFQLRAWNLEDGAGTPIAATPDAFVDRINVGTQAVILGRWVKAVKQPPGESSPPSNAGASSVAE